jgi:UDP-N-acetylglucosamine--N-acetylmuramyl-(pentapeptide) pyrophosphoryl-undecaprenol N-acetylglucosamine transferase
MKIVFTGGGSGGHFYPAIAVAEQVKKMQIEKKIAAAELFFIAPTNLDPEILEKNSITFVKNMAGKVRLYPSIRNIIDTIKTPFAIMQAVITLFKIYPDIVFSKGGYGAFPIVSAARLLRIPVVIHESDTYPGRVNKWTGTFAKRIAVSYPEAAKHFELERVAHTGQPIREGLLRNQITPTKESPIILDTLPLILIIGGSQGARIINEVVIESLIQLLPDYQIVHQTGPANYEEMKTLGEYLLKENPFKGRYTPMSFIDAKTLSYLGRKSAIVVSRASSTLFTIAVWGKPAIIIPITTSNGDHQRMNAYSYARKGAASVIEEKNLTDSILISEIQRVLSNKAVYDSMVAATGTLRNTTAAQVVAEELIEIAETHKYVPKNNH